MRKRAAPRVTPQRCVCLAGVGPPLPGRIAAVGSGNGMRRRA